MPEPGVILSCEGLCLGYEKREVLHGLSFSLREGECLCVLGENGAGKSTLLNALLGLKKPNHGKITYGPGLTQRHIGCVPQQNAAQRDFPALAGEVVRSGFINSMGLRAWYTKEQHARAEDVMARLGIQDIEKRCYRELSGGQQRRVLLARALCAAHKLLLLDEPDTGLDPLAARELEQTIARLHREFGVTVVLVSHDIHFALRGADKVLHIGKGGKQFFGTPEDYRQSEWGRAFLGG